MEWLFGCSWLQGYWHAYCLILYTFWEAGEAGGRRDAKLSVPVSQ